MRLQPEGGEVRFSGDTSTVLFRPQTESQTPSFPLERLPFDLLLKVATFLGT